MFVRTLAGIGRLMALLVLLLPTVFEPRAASAAPILRRTVPAANTTVFAPPKQVSLFFNEALDPAQSRVEILDRAGSRLTSAAIVDPNDPTIIDAIVPPLTNGRYTVSYRGVGRDGTVSEGRFTFTLAIPEDDEDDDHADERAFDDPDDEDEHGEEEESIAWPPVRVLIDASYQGSLVTYRLWLLNLSLRPAEMVTLRGAIPAGARYHSSYLINPDSNPGRTDGTTVGWTLGQPLPPIPFGDGASNRARFGPFVYIVDTAGLAAGTRLRANGWSQWIMGSQNEPDDDSDGADFVEQVGGESASEPVDLVIGANGLPTRVRE